MKVCRGYGISAGGCGVDTDAAGEDIDVFGNFYHGYGMNAGGCGNSADGCGDNADGCGKNAGVCDKIWVLSNKTCQVVGALGVLRMWYTAGMTLQVGGEEADYVLSVVEVRRRAFKDSYILLIAGSCSYTIGYSITTLVGSKAFIVQAVCRLGIRAKAERFNQRQAFARQQE